MSSPSASTGDIHREIDRRLWRACAGDSVQIPLLYSRVYYFPQGHAEHCCGSLSPFISPLSSFTSPVLCLVSSIDLLADPITDEVFVHLVLQPEPPEQSIPSNPSTFRTYEVDEDDNNNLTTYAKTLTSSDVCSRLNVPRNCAESVFPPLDYKIDPPAQMLSIKDIHGVSWDFRYTYCSRPKRDMLTTAWYNFTNKKKLMAGDSVRFMRNPANELFVGIRRKRISNDSVGTSLYGGDEYKQSSGDLAKEKFRRTGKGKLTAEAVSEAINNAAKGLPFEVVYYPRPGWSEFVVRAEDVEVSKAMKWTPGTRVKMAMETEDYSPLSWFQGTVSASTFQESPWKPLQITWETPALMKKVKRVNPWQLDITFSDEMQDEVGSSNPPELSTNDNFFTLLSGADKASTEMTIGSPPPSDDLSPNKINTNLSSGNDLVGSSSARANSIQLFGKTINVQELSESGLAESGLYEEDLTKESSDNE